MPTTIHSDPALQLLANLAHLANLSRCEARVLTSECRNISECKAFDQEDLYDLWHACWNLEDACPVQSPGDHLRLRVAVVREAEYLWGLRYDLLEDLASA